MTTPKSSGAAPEMPFEVELYLITEYQRFAQEAMGDLEPARQTESYLGHLAMGQEGLAEEDSTKVLTAFSGFLVSEFADFTDDQPFMIALRESGLNEESYLEKGRRFGALILHGLEVLDWSEQDAPEITALDLVCWNVAQSLVDAVDSFDRLRGFAVVLSEQGMAA